MVVVINDSGKGAADHQSAVSSMFVTPGRFASGTISPPSDNQQPSLDSPRDVGAGGVLQVSSMPTGMSAQCCSHIKNNNNWANPSSSSPAVPLPDLQQESPRIALKVTPDTVVVENEKRHRLYRICAHVPVMADTQGTWNTRIINHTLRFSAIRDAHCHVETCAKLTDKVPSRHWPFDYTDGVSNVRERASEMQLYLISALSIDYVARSRPFLTALQFERDDVEAIVAFANYSSQLQSLKKQARRDAKARAKEEQEERWRQMFRLTLQELHGHENGDFLTFHEKTTFRMKEDFWRRDAEIIGPNGQPWFRVIKMNFFSFRELYTVTDMSGRPLMALNEQFQLLSHKYSLLRNSHHSATDWCDIEMVHFFGHHYTIRSISRHCPSNIELEGSWGSWHNEFKEHGRRAAIVSKNLTIFNDEYSITLYPGMDVVLYLSLACLIDKMHHQK